MVNSWHEEQRSATASKPRTAFISLALTALVVGCTSAPAELPNPRRLVVHSGARLAPAKADMEEVDSWIREEVDSITADPSFMIITTPQEGPAYPWDGFYLSEGSDTANVRYQAGTDAGNPYLIYAHLQLMAAQDRLDRWYPEAEGLEGYELERAIMARTADTWLYQRSLFDARPYGLLDELVYAKEEGFLDAFILTARPDDFVEARRAWLEENPGRNEEYVAWFQETFQRPPPGLRGG
ncbi:MAG: hypothetical protein HKO53_04230 [Gemmatimonadetes bacterium]|nr:hypothetical protein [Gemmatimonadota bacterium]